MFNTLMSIVGTEIDEKMTPEVERMTKDNPILSKQAQKMLEQLQVTWDDVETSDETLGLTDLSLEQFRQELFEMFQKNKELFERMPNGIFTGFKAMPDKQYPELPGGIIALLGYPAKPDEVATHTYDESTRVNLVKQGFSNENSGIYYKGKFIIPFDKGGESDADSGWLPNYYIPTNYFIDWSNKSVKSLYNRATFQSAKANLRNPDYWFKLGITYSARGVYSPSFRLNSSSVFDSNGSSIFFSNFSLIQGLALLSSKFYRFTLKNYCGHTIATEVDELKDGVIFIIPLKSIEQYVEAIINKQKQNPRYDYASHEQIEIDRLVYEAYGLNENDTQEVENWYVRRYPKLAAAQKANLEAKQKAEQK